jgi:hypothetical protein
VVTPFTAKNQFQQLKNKSINIPAILNTHINLNSFPNLKKYPLIIIGIDNTAIKKAYRNKCIINNKKYL